MKVKKKVISNLTKCYSVAPLYYQEKEHILVAAEKTDRCILFDQDGNEEDTVWREPGGVMTMVQVPGTDGQFLATHQFYSPNDAEAAQIVIVTPKRKGEWERRVLAELPFVHRFDIINRNGVRYLIACTLKSGHSHQDDWSMPGKVYAAVLPDDLGGFSVEHQLELTVIKDHMLKNHGYYHTVDNGIETGIVCSDNGVYRFIPPASADGQWEVEQLLDVPASDAVLVDFDEDGEKELGILSPFHGADIMIFKKVEGSYQKVYQYEKKADFLHAIYGGNLCGRPAMVVGYRKAERNLLMFTYNRERAVYEAEVIDRDCGPANIYHFVKNGTDVLVSTNREINQVAMYTIEA